jgi:osmotically-inducible protein OsmY
MMRTAMAVTWIAALALAAGSARAQDRRAGQAGSPDEERARAIADQLRSDPQLADDRVVVEVTGKRVTLRGRVDDAAERRHAEDLVRRTDPTLEIDDQLQVEGEPDRATPSITERAKEGARDTGRELTDAWVTTKLKTKLLAERGLDVRGVHVTTDRHVVTLSGKVPTEADRRRVIEIARHTDGVLVVIDEMKLTP